METKEPSKLYYMLVMANGKYCTRVLSMSGFIVKQLILYIYVSLLIEMAYKNVPYTLFCTKNVLNTS